MSYEYSGSRRGAGRYGTPQYSQQPRESGPPPPPYESRESFNRRLHAGHTPVNPEYNASNRRQTSDRPTFRPEDYMTSYAPSRPEDHLNAFYDIEDRAPSQYGMSTYARPSRTGSRTASTDRTVRGDPSRSEHSTARTVREPSNRAVYSAVNTESTYTSRSRNCVPGTPAFERWRQEEDSRVALGRSSTQRDASARPERRERRESEALSRSQSQHSSRSRVTSPPSSRRAPTRLTLVNGRYVDERYA